MYNLKPAKWGLRQNSRSFAIFGQHSTKMAWNKISGLYNFKINRTRSTKIKYWKDFLQQSRSSSTFIKRKKGTLMWLWVIWGPHSPCSPSSQFRQPCMQGWYCDIKWRSQEPLNLYILKMFFSSAYCWDFFW